VRSSCAISAVSSRFARELGGEPAEQLVEALVTGASSAAVVAVARRAARSSSRIAAIACASERTGDNP